jgi:CubicO group peptidase (beta-lactamase class C family)
MSCPPNNGVQAGRVLAAALVIAPLFLPCVPASELKTSTAPVRFTRVGIEQGRWQINGMVTYPGCPAEGLLLNVRMVNAVFEDAGRPDFSADDNTEELIAALPDYAAHGVLALTISLQGGMPGYEGAVNTAFAADGSLRPGYLRRVARVIEACDRLGMVMILSCLYQRQDQHLADERAVRRAVQETARWLARQRYTNVVLEIANEYPHGGFDHAIVRSPQGQCELIKLARAAWQEAAAAAVPTVTGAPGILVSTSGLGDGQLDEAVAQSSDCLLIHFNGVPSGQIPDRIAALRKYGKPIVCNEDQKEGEEAARAARISVEHGASWGLMLLDHNQRFPFEFWGARDDPVVYATLAELSRPAVKGVYPGAEWEVRTPQQAGLEAVALDRLREVLGGRGCVVRQGWLVHAWGDIAQRADVASAVKLLYTHFLLKAVAEQRIADFDEPVARFEPRLASLNAGLGHKDRHITWRLLACQTSGYGVREPPGAAFDYSDYNMALLADTLFGRVYECPWPEVDERLLYPLLAEPVGCQDRPTLCAFGPADRPGRLAVSVRDFARFGLLYLRGGRWRDQQLVPCWLVQRVLHGAVDPTLPRTAGEEAEMLPGQRTLGGGRNQAAHQGAYSFAWWTNGPDAHGRRLWPDAPPDTFAALGHGGQRGLAVIPSLDLVLSWNDGHVDSPEKLNRVLRLLAECVQQGSGERRHH